mgnify:CR=1 FL=1
MKIISIIALTLLVAACSTTASRTSDVDLDSGGLYGKSAEWEIVGDEVQILIKKYSLVGNIQKNRANCEIKVAAIIEYLGVEIEPLKRRDYELSRHSSSGNDLCEVFAVIVR